ncbi:CHAD domain-containing protein [Pseudoxanthomonas suwonensis]|uniref:CHAD domain-containing protein n=1 Tax=Pseudoxanthomonas suwonensis TaxID=314722 RepID=UPI000695FB6F|nr:CHAD domain-containing protein [Pseudoxanthomonas suwonensis]
MHEARKAIRRARSALALVEKRLDIGSADRTLQRVGDSLSSLRDAHATVETLARVDELDGGDRWAPAMATLRAHADQVAVVVQGGDPGFAWRQRAIARATAQLAGLPWKTVKPAHLREGLGRQSARVERSVARARKSPTPENIHRWRRRARRLRMQLEAVAKLEERRLQVDAQQPKKLRRLADELGWYQDIQALMQLVRRLPDVPERAALAARLDELLGQCQVEPVSVHKLPEPPA